MDLIAPTRTAFRLLFSGDAELWRIVGTSLYCSLIAIALITPPAVALGFVVAKVSFPGRRAIVVLVQALLSFPTVVVGLTIYMLLSRHGPLGFLQLLFTPEAIIIAYMVIAFPVLAVFTLAAVQGADPRVFETARGLGAGKLRASWTTLVEVRFGIMAAIFNGFGRVISEVGAAIIVGGNIAGLTRNMPTAIALETSKGEFAQGIALGFVLITLALAINAALSVLQGQGGLK